MPIRFVCPVCWTVREGIDDALAGKMVKCQDCHAMSVARHTPAPHAGSVDKASAAHQSRPASGPPGPAVMPAVSAETPEPPPRVLFSTGDVPHHYEIVDVIFAHGSSAEGALKGSQPLQAFQTIVNWLGQTALQIGANAVINLRLDFRGLPSQEGMKPAFEVYGYGTAVKVVY